MRLYPCYCRSTTPRIIHEPGLNGLGRPDYPGDRREVLLLVEEDTYVDAAELVDPDLWSVRVVTGSAQLPRKPKACNYGNPLPNLR